MPNHQFAAGYKYANVEKEAKEIFNAVRKLGVSYVNSTLTFGQMSNPQRVRLPFESLLEKSANCIDGTILLASIFENIGLEPLIILVPGHAFLGLRLAPDSRETLFIETTLLGRSKLESLRDWSTAYTAAVKKGTEEYNSYYSQSPNSIRIIDIKKARTNGIYPLQ